LVNNRHQLACAAQQCNSTRPQSRGAIQGITTVKGSKSMTKTETRRPWRAHASSAAGLRVYGAGNACLTMSFRNEKLVKPSISHCIIPWNPHCNGVLGFSVRPEAFAMHEHVTLLIRLGQIAGERCSCEERASHALALLNAYTAKLYARAGIGVSNRLATSAKSFADQTLADLRRQILAAEIRAADSCGKVFTAVRHRIEMARRVLASRITEETVLCQRPDPLRSSSLRVDHDAQSTDTMRRRIRERRQVTERTPPIERTIDLVPTGTLGRTLRLGDERLHRPCRRARLGSLSGQLTM
jgi:hypothetical protein